MPDDVVQASRRQRGASCNVGALEPLPLQVGISDERLEFWLSSIVRILPA